MLEGLLLVRLQQPEPNVVGLDGPDDGGPGLGPMQCRFRVHRKLVPHQRRGLRLLGSEGKVMGASLAPEASLCAIGSFLGFLVIFDFHSFCCMVSVLEWARGWDGRGF